MSTKKMWREEEIRKIAREEAEKVCEEKKKALKREIVSIYNGKSVEQIKEMMALGKIGDGD